MPWQLYSNASRSSDLINRTEDAFSLVHPRTTHYEGRNIRISEPYQSAQFAGHRFDTALEQSSNPHAQDERVGHVIFLGEHQGKAQCFLKVHSHAPNAKSLPVFIKGEPVAGTVELDLQEPNSIKAITISVSYIAIFLSIAVDEMIILCSSMEPSSIPHRCRRPSLACLLRCGRARRETHLRLHQRLNFTK